MVMCTFSSCSRGQLGLGDIKTHTTPQVIDLLGGINVIRISTGGWHSLALTGSYDSFFLLVNNPTH